MATRQDIQVAQDLVRFVNVMNDLFDCASYLLQDIDPQTGVKYQTRNEDGSLRDTTVEELKNQVRRTGQSISGYQNMIASFIQGYGKTKVINALQSIGIDFDSIQTDLSCFKAEAGNLRQNLQNAQTKVDLVSLANHIDAKVPKLTLVRRTWCLKGRV